MILTKKEIMQLSKYKDKPCFLFNKQKFNKNCDLLKKKFPNFDIAYSVKTNNSEIVVKNAFSQFKKLEICSSDELKKALKIGANYKNIIYNGVLSETNERFKVASNGGIVNIDNFSMFKKLADKAQFKRKCIEVGIRINGDIGNGISRFGVIPFSKEWNDIFSYKNDYVKIVGINFHRYGGRSLEKWEKKLDIICNIVRQMKNLKYIDFGSNFYGFMDKRLSVQFGNDVTDMKNYAILIEKKLKPLFLKLPQFIIEPGTPVVADCVDLLSKIDTIRENKAILNVSKFDIGFLIMSKKIPFTILKVANKNGIFVSELDGYACTENDVIEKNINEYLNENDYCLFNNIGAYSFSLGNDFICEKIKMYEK